MIGLVELAPEPVVRRALERSGTALSLLPPGAAALERLADDGLTALILELDRLDAAARELLAVAHGRQLPVLVVSRAHGVAAAVESLRAGASDYLKAPFELESLLRAVDRLLDASCAAEALNPDGDTGEFLTQEPEMRTTLELARTSAARSPAPSRA